MPRRAAGATRRSGNHGAAHCPRVGPRSLLPRESDAQCFARASVYVDTPEGLAKAGDVLQAIPEGAFSAEQLQGTLAQLCPGERPGRTAALQIELFKSVGTALEDLAAAELVWEALAPQDA